MKALLSNFMDAFKDPSSPWYYAVGAAFLALIFVALAIFVVVSKKRAKSEQAEAPAEEQKEEPVAEQAEEAQVQEEQPEPQTPVKEEVCEPEQKPEQEPEPQTPAAEEKQEEPEPEKAPEPEKEQKEQEPAVAEEKPVEEKAPQKPAAPQKKRPLKPFIDRLIAEKSVHGIYNELKNTILSYPGIRAKLTRDDEKFYFGTDAKAGIRLDDATITLGLAIDKAAVPSQFKDVKESDGELPTALEVTEDKIDEAQKLITFAMNISMLTRNERKRTVDYIQNAIDAKNRAKRK